MLNSCPFLPNCRQHLYDHWALELFHFIPLLKFLLIIKLWTSSLKKVFFSGCIYSWRPTPKMQFLCGDCFKDSVTWVLPETTTVPNSFYLQTTDLLTQAMTELSQTLTTDYRTAQGDYQRIQYIPVSQAGGNLPQSHIQLQVVQVAPVSSAVSVSICVCIHVCIRNNCEL